MPLRISKIEIKNFKTYKSLTFFVNDNFNIIIGANNIGKTTIFEAILLWEKCYQHLISSDKRNFYKSDSNHYINFHDLYFVRATSDKDMFYSKGPLSIIITFKDTDSSSKEFRLGIDLHRPTSIANSYLRLKHKRYLREYQSFVEYLKEKRIKTPEAIFIYQTKPISTILRQEPFMNNAQILKKISIDKSHEVLRNKILKCDESKGEDPKGLFIKLTSIMNEILDENYEIVKKNQSDDNEEYIKISIINDELVTDLSLMGSGVLQILEIFSTLDYIEERNYPLKIMLIDEPDSHIHATLQKRLIRKLREISDIQIFVISHNDRFVNDAEDGELFYINEEKKSSGILEPLKNMKDLNIVKNDLGGTILALEKFSTAKKIILVEGTQDIKYIKQLILQYNKLFTNRVNLEDFAFLHLRGRGNILNKTTQTMQLITQLAPGKSFGLIFDKDFSTISAIESMKNRLSTYRLCDFVYIHEGYCIESTLFSDENKLAGLLTSAVQNCVFGKSYEIAFDYVQKVIRDELEYFKKQANDINSEFIKDLEQKYNSQSTERPENADYSFNDFLREANHCGLPYILNKSTMDQIMKRIIYKIYPYWYNYPTIEDIFELLIPYSTKSSWLDSWNIMIEQIKG